MPSMLNHELPRDKNGITLTCSPIVPFLIANLDSGGGYYAFQSPDGQYIIQKVTSTTIRYYRGKDGGSFAADWTGRAALTYGLPQEVL